MIRRRAGCSKIGEQGPDLEREIAPFAFTFRTTTSWLWCVRSLEAAGVVLRRDLSSSMLYVEYADKRREIHNSLKLPNYDPVLTGETAHDQGRDIG